MEDSTSTSQPSPQNHAANNQHEGAEKTHEGDEKKTEDAHGEHKDTDP